jgi:hypothetical protein
MALKVHDYFYLEFWGPQKTKNLRALERWFLSFLLSKSTLKHLERQENWNLHMHLLHFVPNILLWWKWLEVYPYRFGWFRVLLINSQFNARLVTRWSAHLQSLCLAGTKAIECYGKAGEFLDISQSMYILLSVFWHRLDVLYPKMSENDKKHLLRVKVSLVCTWWRP